MYSFSICWEKDFFIPGIFYRFRSTLGVPVRKKFKNTRFGCIRSLKLQMWVPPRASNSNISVTCKKTNLFIIHASKIPVSTPFFVQKVSFYAKICSYSRNLMWQCPKKFFRTGTSKFELFEKKPVRTNLFRTVTSKFDDFDVRSSRERRFYIELLWEILKVTSKVHSITESKFLYRTLFYKTKIH